MKLISMKTPALILALLFSSFISTAQIERIPKKTDSLAGSNSRSGKKDLVKELGLSTGQQAKLKEIRQTIRMKRKAIDNNDQLSDEEKKKQLRELQRSQAKSIEEILTDEQREKFRKNRKKMAEQNS
jgi:hypothetical protein